MTKGEINRLGERIARAPTHVDGADVELLQNFRVSFREPIAEVFSFLSNAVKKVDKNCVVTYRIKRIDSIIRKLGRFAQSDKGSMQLSRMGDIAGCRCIFNSSDEQKLYGLVDLIRKEYGSDVTVNDSVKNPKPTGYRSIHVYVKDHKTKKPVEIQIRNRTHHNWATLVEIVDVLYHTSIKELGPIGPLGEFLVLYSNKEILNKKERLRLLRIESKEKLFERISSIFTSNYLGIKHCWLNQYSKGSFFVIETDNGRSSISVFPSFDQAEKEYYSRYLANMQANIVLTHIKNPSFEEISMAYSNYVLAMHAFIDEYRELLINHIVDCVDKRAYVDFWHAFNVYYRNLRCYFKSISREIKSVEEYRVSNKVNKSQLKKWVKDLTQQAYRWKYETKTFVKRLAKASKQNLFFAIVIPTRLRKLTRVINQARQE